MTADARFMRLALSLGLRGLGQVWPNPAVGCVIVRDGIIVGRGSTRRGGRPHAETVALDQAGDAARGATAYVTLEPCAHHGKTPPCADALVAAGLSRVVVATGDPDPRTAGRGLQILRDAGITVDLGLMDDAARAANAGFLKSVTDGLPWVTLKLASTLDGRIATSTGESRWITGSLARRAVHGLRRTHDAVLIGAGTARADDPMLDVRDLGTDLRQPVRVVLSRDLNLPINGRLAQTAKAQPVWLIHAEDAAIRDWAGTGATLIPCATQEHQIDITAALREMASRGITRVLCEGGSHMAASLLHHGVVDEVVVMQAGCAIGSDGLPSLAGMGVRDLSDAPRFDLTEVRAIGNDTLQCWRPRSP
ncbi:bifunctional diaminohydroxyphosphoribosylaminopyrimidine deaminase/5-amino-6-(5-phosphoribosylamino)uracil reductase RibD [Loktanella sp. SALINAS62]|uniref:bifunctional diaminohydroxyphosphoribosylaminopyrimidine deaminase/5-amino-6-(5-phosphoribosylamino)uracil reductase RibD n=1 Tax=Loktanella sp. SALINAS62 TaxID=2706124 RepID=UPI001B8D475A|nr:bifunctional diaminohydroxyphosphoribosylaminopyrimidine deaminase/5-amino-6-(5-phosphoribosylamino)uracil reductase RibD [Loktanella sp. SALINAS62]MBS1303036.1 bifunctional diaminohydroxyphosphoribosylaminopyrimidine deaminase/5-amino-6-(5-phosphoribosylamino)uracil reductase RibD [Loktanella sp. SALINAS62]